MKLSPKQNRIESDEPTCPDHWQFVLMSAYPSLGHLKKSCDFSDGKKTVVGRTASRLLIGILNGSIAVERLCERSAHGICCHRAGRTP